MSNNEIHNIKRNLERLAEFVVILEENRAISGLRKTRAGTKAKKKGKSCILASSPKKIFLIFSLPISYFAN
ncbi:hypothetical protein [Heyndrickxia acidicola]|uniref:Uncharacterized protein n=1 Tax=Heyndrickxia acidicola TaxID=209389 RepID=A0ABU6MLB6_9BACI|nr:hypothetical protein [Heyndrickxia acidicola]MED1205158.1 hypothetical protein [Heyndrickxia acidicola]